MSAITSLRYEAGLARAIAAGSERVIHAYLKRFQRPLWIAFAHGWNAILVAPEFRFGRDYRADFVVLSSLSGALHATLVELEAPGAALYLKDGTESKTLRTALRQVKDWSAWVTDHPEQFRRELTDEIERAAREDRRIPAYRHRFMRAELVDRRRVILDHYAIVVGRRDTLSPEDNQRRGNESKWSARVEIATYDRLLEIARQDSVQFRELRQRPAPEA